MINTTRHRIFRSAAASRVINRNYRCVCVSREKNRVLHDSWSFKTDQWFISPVATGGAHEFPKRRKRKIANEKETRWTMMGWERGIQKGPGFAPNIFFCHPKMADLRPTVLCWDDIYLSPFETNYRGCSHAVKRPPSFDRREGETEGWDDFLYCDTRKYQFYFYVFFIYIIMCWINTFKKISRINKYFYFQLFFPE